MLSFEREREEISLFSASSHCRVREVSEAEGDAEVPLGGPLAACQSHSNKPPSEGVTHAHPQTCAGELALLFFFDFLFLFFLHTVPANLLSPNYSRLEPALLSLILSVRGAQGGNSDISV